MTDDLDALRADANLIAGQWHRARRRARYAALVFFTLLAGTIILPPLDIVWDVIPVTIAPTTLAIFYFPVLTAMPVWWTLLYVEVHSGNATTRSKQSFAIPKLRVAQ